MTDSEPKPLTAEEMLRLRELLVADGRRRWLISALAGASKWIVAIAAAWLAVKGLIAEAFPWVK